MPEIGPGQQKKKRHKSQTLLVVAVWISQDMIYYITERSVDDLFIITADLYYTISTTCNNPLSKKNPYS